MEKKSVVVETVPARAVVAFLRAPKETRTVEDYEAAQLALADPENVHVCPLCKEPFKTEAFKLHGPECIKLRVAALERNREKPLDDQWRERRRKLFIFRR